MTGRIGGLQQTLLRLLADAPVSTRELAAWTQAPTTRVRRSLRQLEGRGILVPDRPVCFGRGGALDVRWRVVAEPTVCERDADVLDSLRTLGPTTIRALADDTGRPTGDVRWALLALVERRQARRVGDTRPAIWEAA